MSIKLDSKQQEEIFRNLESQGISGESLDKVSGGISLQPSNSATYTTLAIGEEHPWWP